MTRHPSLRLSGEDLTFWWYDSPMQPTTMAMLMLLDRAPEKDRLDRAFARAVAAVPRLRQRVADAPLELTLPHWEDDPTFSLDYHVRHHALAGRGDLSELFHELAPAYETPFDRSRPLWEARVYEAVGEKRHAALFFKLHHAVADGVGGNAIFAAMTDAERASANGGDDDLPLPDAGPWPRSPSMPERLLEAARDRASLELERVGAVTGTILDTIRHPGNIGRAVEGLRSIIASVTFDSHSPLKSRVGRARRLTGLDLPFDEVRQVKHALGGAMIDVILTVMARGMGKWHAAHGMADEVRELLTLVPLNLRTRDQWAESTPIGNVATGILVALPIGIHDPLASHGEIRRRMIEKKADPGSAAAPVLAEILSVLPRGMLTWMAEITFANVDFIVTNVPGILVPRYLAGAEILAAYPFAPVAMRSPVSVALYGYRDRLFIGLNSDTVTMPDVDLFQTCVREAFMELKEAAGIACRAPGK
jgi:WS/DGAT/MGAT family acyltransferase